MSSVSIECVCLDDKNRPKEIPTSKWPVKDQWYNITHVFKMKNMNNILGCELAEFDISMCDPYNCFLLTRFGIRAEDLAKLIKMFQDTADLNDVTLDVNKLTEIIETELETV